MTERRFACTACGMCCYGILPLTLDEALARADRFPLAISITPVKAGVRGYTSVARTGASLQISAKQKINLSVAPVSFVPPSMPCPELTSDNLCAVHAEKPLRCRAMPFYAYKDEDHQADLLAPRKGWLCATSADAPVVYRDRRIVDRGDFDAERAALVDQAPALRRYVDLLLNHDAMMRTRVLKAAQAPIAGRVVAGFVSFLRFDATHDILDFARRQQPILETWRLKTADDPRLCEFNSFYAEASRDLGRYLAQPGRS